MPERHQRDPVRPYLPSGLSDNELTFLSQRAVRTFNQVKLFLAKVNPAPDSSFNPHASSTA
jgi:hypothetical protein